MKRAYQPLLVSLQFDKRRWKNDEPFRGKIWIVNDKYESHRDCTVEMVIKDNHDQVISNRSFNADVINENSSKLFFEIEEDVLGGVEKNFFVTLSLKDRSGTELSSNEYMLLIGDQKAASEQFKVMGNEVRARIGDYTAANYYRYFPDMTREDGNDHHGDTNHPKASGF